MRIAIEIYYNIPAHLFYISINIVSRVLFSAPAAEDLVIIALKEQESVENQRYFNPLSG